MALSQEKQKKLKNKLGRSARTFTGEDLAGRVIAWLQDKDCPPDDPVRELREHADRPWDMHGAKDFIMATERKWAFHFYRSVEIAPEGPKLKLQHVTNQPITPENSKRLLAWNDAVLLWSRGLLDRIRVCAREGCGKLFFARFSHSEYHEDACRLAVEVANPEYKQSRREYMRKQRQQAKKGKRGKKS